MKDITHPYYFSKIKQCFDCVTAILFILLSLPMWLILFPMLLFTTGRPIIFKQLRMGKDQKPFTIYKFRTMVKNAAQIKNELKNKNQAPEPMFKIFDDPRFIGIGKLLSKTGIDETPQFINILKGDMSFVGPRPLPVSETEQLPKSWDFRYQVKPGLFSEWTLSLNRHSSLQAWKELERKTLSFGGVIYDIKIILRVILAQIYH